MVRTLLLPEFIQELPENLQTGWVNIYKEVFDSYGENLAKIAANNWLKEQLEDLNMEAEVPKDMEGDDEEESKEEEVVEKEEKKSPLRITFEIEGVEGQFVKSDAEGNDYVDLVLQDSNVIDSRGEMWEGSLLKKWANQINAGSVEVFGDINHDEYNEVVGNNIDPDIIKAKLKEKKQNNSIAKGVKAVYEKGKLWLRATIDKRYKSIINKGVGVSAEAYTDDNIKHKDGDLLGFSFILNGPQSTPTAMVV